MAILYGTQSNGETLPVLVDQFGNLLAKGINGEPGEPGQQGPPGPQGPQGEPGKDGTCEPVISDFLPYFACSDSGKVTIEYKFQSGKTVRWGNYVEHTGMIQTENALITDARGTIRIYGFDPIANGINGKVQLNSTATLFFTGFKSNNITSPVLNNLGDFLTLRTRYGANEVKKLATTEFNEGSEAIANIIVFKVWGVLVNPEVVARRQQIREAAEKRFDDQLISVSTTDIDLSRPTQD